MIKEAEGFIVIAAEFFIFAASRAVFAWDFALLVFADVSGIAADFVTSDGFSAIFFAFVVLADFSFAAADGDADDGVIASHLSFGTWRDASVDGVTDLRIGAAHFIACGLVIWACFSAGSGYGIAHFVVIAAHILACDFAGFACTCDADFSGLACGVT